MKQSAWLENGEYSFGLIDNYEDKILDQALTALGCSRWIDETLVSGNAEAESIAIRALAYFLRIGDFSLLAKPPDGPLAILKSITVRLKGLNCNRPDKRLDP